MQGIALVIIALFIDGLTGGLGLALWAATMGTSAGATGILSFIPFAGTFLGASASAGIGGAGIALGFVANLTISATLGSGFTVMLPLLYGHTHGSTMHRLMLRFLRYFLAKLIPGIGYLPLWTFGTVLFIIEERRNARKLLEKGNGQESTGGEESADEPEAPQRPKEPFYNRMRRFREEREQSSAAAPEFEPQAPAARPAMADIRPMRVRDQLPRPGSDSRAPAAAANDNLTTRNYGFAA